MIYIIGWAAILISAHLPHPWNAIVLAIPIFAYVALFFLGIMITAPRGGIKRSAYRGFAATRNN